MQVHFRWLDFSKKPADQGTVFHSTCKYRLIAGILQANWIEKWGQDSYRQDCVKFKDFSRTSKRLSYCFQGLIT